MHHHEKQNAILDYWFGDLTLRPLGPSEKWFPKVPARKQNGSSGEPLRVDLEIRERFGDLLELAETGAFDDWAKTPLGALALVVVCDQFPRNVYRGTGRAFALDERALRVAQIAIASGFDQKMAVVQRCFLYLPFEHSEKIDMQDRSVELFTALANEAQGDEKKFIGETLEYARRHRDVIGIFGRFPHRNHILGRESTHAEIEFLKRPGSSF